MLNPFLPFHFLYKWLDRGATQKVHPTPLRVDMEDNLIQYQNKLAGSYAGSSLGLTYLAYRLIESGWRDLTEKPVVS